MALGARRTSFWCLILVPLAVLCSVVDLSSSVSISYVSPRRGSLAGGTRLTVYGNGFLTDAYSFVNLVYIGDLPCTVETYTVSRYRLYCVTSPYPNATEGQRLPRLQSRIIISGGDSFESRFEGQSFYYDWNYTPQIQAIEPNSGPVGSMIEIGGYRMRWGYDNYGPFFLGGQVCNTRNPETNQHYGIRWRSSLHFVPCVPAESQAGGWNASVTVENSRGLTWNHSSALYPMFDWKLAMYELFPDIHQVKPQVGSIKGGTLLTITGSGFGFKENENEVDVDGIPCQIVTQSPKEITCWTGEPAPDSPAIADASMAYPAIEEGYRFKGSRGVNVRRYNNIAGSSLLDLRNADRYPDNPHQYGTYLSFSTRTYDNGRNNYGERMTAFFRPHASGTHTFFVTNDDNAELFLAPGNNITATDSNRIISTRRVSGWNNYYSRSDEQRASPLQLTSDQDYLMVGEFKESGGGDYLQVGVLMHDTDFTYGQTQQAVRERQEIQLRTDGLYNIQSLHLVMNTSQVDTDSPPMFLVEWDGRESNPLPVTSLQDGPELLRETILSLFEGVCDFGIEIGIFHLDDNIYSFEDGNVRTSDGWRSWNGVAPEISETESYCGRHSIYFKDSRALAFNYNPTDYDGFRTSDYPYLCLAYKLPPGHPMSIAVNIRDYGWRAIPLSTTGSFVYPVVGSFWDYSDADQVIDDNNWHYSCTDIQSMLNEAQSLRPSENPEDEDSNTASVHRILGMGFYTDPDPQQRGFYVDEVSFSSEERIVALENYLPPARPNGIALHDVIVTSHMLSDTDDSTLHTTVSMEIVPASCDYNIPFVNITLLNEDAPGVSEFNLSHSQVASRPLDGTYTLSFNSNTTTPLAHDATPDEIKVALEALDRVEEVTIIPSSTSLPQDRLGLFCPGRSYSVQFEKNPGDLDLLEIDSSNLTGDGLNINVVETLTGGLFLRPIPGHMLQTVETTPQVHLRVRGQLAACSGDVDLYETLQEDVDICSFKYASSGTPIVTSIYPLTGASGDTIQIQGSGFSQAPSENFVRFGDTECVVSTSSSIVINCTLQESFAGPKPLYVHVVSAGIAETNNIVLNYTLTLNSVNVFEGSRGGGTEIVISGSGFYINDETNGRETSPTEDLATSYLVDILLQQCNNGWENRVRVGSNPCDIISTTATSLTCTTPEDTGNSSPYDITATIHCIGNNEATAVATIMSAFNYTDALTPTIVSVAPMEGSIKGDDMVTITGTGFADDLIDNQVMFGDVPCTITEVTNTTVVCITLPHRQGIVTIAVIVRDKGRALGNVEFTYGVSINNLSHCSGSLFGGQVLSINGSGFGQDPRDVDIRLGSRICTVVSVTNEQLICTTSPTSRTHHIDNNAEHEEYGLGYKWNPETLTISVGDSVEWSWTGSSFAARRNVAQVYRPGDTRYNGVGFRSPTSVTGRFNHTFTTAGIYNYIAEGYGHIGFNGSITVQALQDISAELSVSINGIGLDFSSFSIACGDDPSSTLQHYTYSVGSTPVISSITQSATPGDRISLELRGISELPSDNIFTLGGLTDTTCTLSHPAVLSTSQLTPDYSSVSTARNYSSYIIQCTVPNLQPGKYRTNLHVAGKGWAYASLDSTTITIQPRVEIPLSTNRGSLRGGITLEIPTTGLSSSDITRTRVVIGNTPCPVQSIDNQGRITCATQPAIDDGYSSLVRRDQPLAHWSLQTDYYRSNGSYLNSDGGLFFRSGGSLSIRANARIQGTVTNRQTGISGNSFSDQAVLFEFEGSYIEAPGLEEITNPAGFGMDLWIKLTTVSPSYQIIVNSSTFVHGIARGFLLVINPCNEIEFWLSTGNPQNYDLGTSVECPIITNTSYCPQQCIGFRIIPAGSILPVGVWHVLSGAANINWTIWQHVAFGWAAEDDYLRYSWTSNDCTASNLCSGEQSLSVSGEKVNASATYLRSPGTPIQIGGASRQQLWQRTLTSFVGHLDEVTFYSSPLEVWQVAARVYYGTSENQPIWVIVDGVDGVGTGVIPNVVYSDVTDMITQETLVDWDTTQDGVYTLDQPSTFRFEWTGFGGVREVTHSVYESCDLEASYMRQWGANLKGGATTVLLERGRTYYFIDSVVGGCIGGRKLRAQIGSIEVIDWRIRQYDDMTIPKGTGLVFTWSGPVRHNIIEMASSDQSPNDCRFAGGNSGPLGQVVKEWQSEFTSSGEVTVSDLSLGRHHFVCSVPGHCQRGMSLTVTVVPTTNATASPSDRSESPVVHTIDWRIQYYDDLTIVDGESLQFTWEGFHSLHQVTEDVYSNCNLAADSLYIWGEPSVDNRAIIDGLVPGTYYFICSVAGHCDAGMKIKVIVLPNDGLPLILNPIQAICSDIGNCSFTYSTTATPQLFTVTPTETAAGVNITIRGQGLLSLGSQPGSSVSSATVWIDKAPCSDVIVVSASELEDELVCILMDYESNYYHVDVYVDGKGYASIAPTDLVPGDIRNSTISANFRSPYPKVFLSATANDISPTMGSRLGGTLLTISGTGFSHIPNRLSVSLGSTPCRIVSSTLSEIQCISSASTNPTGGVTLSLTVNGFPVSTSLLYTFSPQSTPTITGLRTTTVNAGDDITIQGSRFGNVSDDVQVRVILTGTSFDTSTVADNCTPLQVSDSEIICRVPQKPAGSYSVVVLVRGLGIAEATPGESTLTYSVSIDSFNPQSGGYGGGITLTLNGHGFPNIPSDAEDVNELYNAISVTVCNTVCTVTSSSSEQVNCTLEAKTVSSPFNTDTLCNVSISYNNVIETSETCFQYNGSSTPRLDTMSPDIGGTGGGTLVILNGMGFLPQGVNPFNLNGNDIIVTIDGALCIWSVLNQPPSDTSISCRTSEHRTTLQAEVKVFVRDKGHAIFSDETLLFEYVDLWSSPFTWGGGPLPILGDSVYIKPGQTVYLDISPPVLNLLLIEGAVVFDDEHDLHLQAKYIFINTGKLQIGTEENPFQHRAIITLHGTIGDPEIPIYGSKVLGIRQGELDLHGLPHNSTWTRLANTADINATSIELQEAVDWEAGDKIVIAPTGKDGNETEDNEILSVSNGGRTIELLYPLNYTHHGITETLEDGQFIEMRAEVGLITHNVVVQGSVLEDPTGTAGLGADQFGAQIFIHRMGPHPTPIRIEHTEVRQSGQAFRLGRYSIHFHLSGSMNGSYIRHCSIHHSFNRAITAHGVHDLLIEGNVAYDIKGHTYFVEDGIETNNRYIGNLGVLTRGSSSLLNTDQIPATFWITNPQNTFIGNAAAGSRAYGFWYDLDNFPSGASRTTSVCPNKAPFGVFRDNVAHSCNEFGLRIWETYQPFADGCRAGEHQVAILYNFTTYANGIHGVELTVVGHVQLDGFKVADNVDNGIEILETHGSWGGPMIRNTLIISHSTINTGPPQTGGIKTPNTPRLTISNVTFANFDTRSTSCLRACSHCKVRQGGFQVWFEQLNFIGGSDQNKASFQWEFEVLFRDLDGTLTGIEGGGWVLPHSNLNPTSHCNASVPEFSVNPLVGGSVCNNSVNFLRMAWNEAEPLTTLMGVAVIATNEFGNASIPWRHYRLTHLDGYMFTLPDGYSHNLIWNLIDEHRIDTSSYDAGIYGVRQDTRLWLTHEFVMLPDHVEIGENFEPTDHDDTPDENDANFSWHINNETNILTYLISGENLTSNSNVTYSYSYEPCPRSGCPPPDIFGPYEPFQRRWSDSNSWPSGAVPVEGENVTISSRWRMLVDISSPSLGLVVVLGELMFEDSRDYNFTANLIIIQGPMARMIIGTENRPFSHKVTITLTGRREDRPIALARGLILGSKAIGVFGNLSIHGVQKASTWSRLASSVMAGNSTIILQPPYPNWAVEDELVIAPSGYDTTESEIRSIVEYNRGNGVITLNEPLSYDHVIHQFLEPSDLTSADPSQTEQPWWGDGGELAPEVGVITRNIVIQGGEDPSQPLEQHHYGCRLLVGEYTSRGFTFSGHAWLDSVEFRFCGQGGYFSPRDPRYSIAFRNNFDSSIGSYVRKCSIHHGYNTAIGVHTSNGIRISENVIWRTTDSSVKVGGSDNVVENNLAVLTTTVQPNTPPDNHAVDFPATFDIDGGNILRGNAAAASTRLAFRFGGESCIDGNRAPVNEEATFWDNTAHTGLIGLSVLGLPEDCTAVGGFTSMHQWNYAIFSSTASSLVTTHLKIGVGKVGLNLNVFGPNPVKHLLGKKFVSINDSLLVGSLPNEPCLTRAPGFRVRGGVSFDLSDHKLGIMMSSFNQKRSKMDGTGAWHLMKGYPVIDGVVNTNGLSFARFFGEGCQYNSFAIGNNPLSPDAVHPMHMTGTNKYNVELNSLVFFYEPDVEWINQEDCVDMDCDGPKHALIRDIDGRFVNTFPAQGSVIPFAELRFANYSNRIPEVWLANTDYGVRAQPSQVIDERGVARGEPGNLDSQHGGCVWVTSWQAYRCKTLQHHMLIIESLDEDTETRRLSPLALNGGDTGSGHHYTDLINGPMDHGWCTYYTCLKRLSTFFTIVAVGTDYSVWMTGSPPTTLRFHLLNAESEDVIKMQIWFKNTQRKDIYKNGIFIEPENVEYLPEGGVQQLDGDHIPQKDMFGGANYFDRETQFMHLIIKGSDPIEIRTPPVVQISMSLAVSIDDFFEVGALIKNLAFVLKINPNRIRVVKIVSEDTPLRARRSLLAVSSVNQTNITLEFGNPPQMNITTPEPPTVADEIAMDREINDSVDLEDNLIPDAPLAGSNPLNEDPPNSLEDFVGDFNSTLLDFVDSVEDYEDVLMDYEETNVLGEQVINLVLTGEIENVTNATVTSLAVVPAIPPPPPEIPVIPPRYENATDEEGNPVIPPVDEIVTPPPIVSVTDDDDGQKTINFIIPSEMIVTREPYETTGHLVHVAVTILDDNGDPVLNLGIVNSWMCEATLVHGYNTQVAPQLGGDTSVPFVRGVAEFTRLRVDRPGEELILKFRTNPTRFETTTSVRFTVVPPPGDTERNKVRFELQGDVNALPSDDSAILTAIRQGLAEQLNVDISRFVDINFNIQGERLVVSIELLDSQPTDPPDVLNLQSSINKLRELINTNQLTITIGDEAYTGVSGSFDFVKPTEATPLNNNILIIAICSSVGAALFVVVVVITLCVYLRQGKKTKDGKGNRRTNTANKVEKIPLHARRKISPEPPSLTDSDSIVDLTQHTPSQSSTRIVNNRQTLPNVPLHQNNRRQANQNGDAFANPYADCWVSPTNPHQYLAQRSPKRPLQASVQAPAAVTLAGLANGPRGAGHGRAGWAVSSADSKSKKRLSSSNWDKQV